MGMQIFCTNLFLLFFYLQRYLFAAIGCGFRVYDVLTYEGTIIPTSYCSIVCLP